MRKIIVLTGRLCEEEGHPGFRQYNHLLKKTKGLYRNAQKKTNSYRKSKSKKEKKEKEMKAAHKKYVIECAKLIERVKSTVAGARTINMKSVAIICEIKKYIKHGERQIDQIARRVLNGEKIPHEEKVFSLFEEHTEWLSKGKAGVPQELGLNVCIVEDQYKFILNHMVMEKTVDEQIAVPITEETKRIFPSLGSISFDKNFWTPANKEKLEKIVEVLILPKKGKLKEKEREKENREEYRKYRKKHSAVESGINALENHGLDRCCDHGINGFKRYVALAIVARNLQNLGNIIQQKEIENQKKQEKLKQRKSA